MAPKWIFHRGLVDSASFRVKLDATVESRSMFRKHYSGHNYISNAVFSRTASVLVSSEKPKNLAQVSL